MGKKNYLIDGVSGSGKSSVCAELRRRDYAAVDGDKELAYQGDPETGEPTSGALHQNHIWDVSKVRKLIDNDADVLFFCGGSRNHQKFINLFDDVFVLDVSDTTIKQRLGQRPGNGWGKRPEELSLILKLNKTKEDLPYGQIINAEQPIETVVEEILNQIEISTKD